jgi:response regulator of citrate/malate metabolism
MIFILDDDPIRINLLVGYITQKFSNSEIITADCADEAKLLLKNTKKFSIMFLDHDLGNRIYVNSNEENTGYQVAKYIVEKGIQYDQCIIQ